MTTRSWVRKLFRRDINPQTKKAGRPRRARLAIETLEERLLLDVGLGVGQPGALLDNPALRYISASVLAFAPVFLANVIFSNSFRESEAADVAFASNLLGIMVGGMMEYFSMLIGYHMLLVPVILFYALAMVTKRATSSEYQG